MTMIIMASIFLILSSFDETDAKLIGKGATFVYLVGKILTIRNPHEENKYTNFVNGSTLIFKKIFLKKLSFKIKTLQKILISAKIV